MSALFALLKRDLRLAIRQGGGAGTALGFLLAVIVLLPIGLGPDQATLGRIAPGFLWIVLLLAVLLSADRIFQPDYEDGSLEVMVISPVPLEMAALTKAAAHWLTTSLPLAIASPLLGILIALPPAAIVPLGIAMILGSASLSLLASTGAAITVGLRRGGKRRRLEVGEAGAAVGALEDAGRGCGEDRRERVAWAARHPYFPDGAGGRALRPRCSRVGGFPELSRNDDVDGVRSGDGVEPNPRGAGGR